MGASRASARLLPQIGAKIGQAGGQIEGRAIAEPVACMVGGAGSMRDHQFEEMRVGAHFAGALQPPFGRAHQRLEPLMAQKAAPEGGNSRGQTGRGVAFLCRCLRMRNGGGERAVPVGQKARDGVFQ